VKVVVPCLVSLIGAILGAAAGIAYTFSVLDYGDDAFRLALGVRWLWPYWRICRDRDRIWPLGVFETLALELLTTP
jgi:hypothetical protein